MGHTHGDRFLIWTFTADALGVLRGDKSLPYLVVTFLERAASDLAVAWWVHAVIIEKALDNEEL